MDLSAVDIGVTGEDLACKYLIEQGYSILNRNFRYGSLEIDIVALKEDTLAFAEVKTRSFGSLVSPLEAVTRQKQRNIINAAAFYVKKYNCSQEVSFDIITVKLYAGRDPEIEHIPNAFYPQFR